MDLLHAPSGRIGWMVERTFIFEVAMRNEFTALIERDGEWYIGYCPEIPGANGQGRTVEECRANLADAIALILEDRREDGLRGAPEDAIRETVTIGRNAWDYCSTCADTAVCSSGRAVRTRSGPIRRQGRPKP